MRCLDVPLAAHSSPKMYPKSALRRPPRRLQDSFQDLGALAIGYLSIPKRFFLTSSIFNLFFTSLHKLLLPFSAAATATAPAPHATTALTLQIILLNLELLLLLLRGCLLPPLQLDRRVA